MLHENTINTKSMSEAFGHVSTAPPPPPPSLRLVTAADLIEQAEVTQATEADEKPEDTVVQDRNSIKELVMLKNPDAKTLQEAFRDFDLDAKILPGSCEVTSTSLEDGNAVYRV